MIDFNSFFEALTQYPTNIGFVMFSILFCLMLLSIVFSIGDSDVSNGIDGFHLDSIDNILVSSGISRVPVVVGLSVTFFFATIISFAMNNFIIYSFGEFLSSISELLYYIVLGAIFFVYFVISLYIAGFVLKPLAKVWDIKPMTTDYYAQDWEVISTEVNDQYGEVKTVIDMLEHRVQVINKTGDKIYNGDKVLLKEKVTPNSTKYYVELVKKDT